MENFKIDIDGKDKFIKNISYISLVDSEVETFLKQVDYNLE
jgi:hypothetical protein